MMRIIKFSHVSKYPITVEYAQRIQDNYGYAPEGYGFWFKDHYEYNGLFYAFWECSDSCD